VSSLRVQLCEIVGTDRAARCIAILSERAFPLDDALTACAAVVAEAKGSALEELAAALVLSDLAFALRSPRARVVRDTGGLRAAAPVRSAA
jgi:hypothetical protein